MVYKWKLPGIYKVDAQTAGDELERIFQEKGTLDPAQIVEESKSEAAPLHPCFEWNDDIAAKKYREVQAGNIIRAIVTVRESNEGEQIPVRAFVSVKQNYEPLRVVIRDEGKMEALLRQAYEDMAAFKRKYRDLSALKPVFDAIDALSA